MKMATIKSVMYTFAILLSLSVVLAEDASTTSPKSIPGLPNFPSFPGFSGSGFPSFQGIPNFSSMMPTLPSFTGSRQRRQADTTEASAEDPTHEHQERLFFALFPSVSACNFTTNPGTSCASCTQALTCFSSNVGLRKNCHGLFRYCNNGRCSLSRGAACTTSTSTSTSTTTTTTTTTTPATGG